MVTTMILALAVTTQNSPERHVRATEPKILKLIDAGQSHSATFRSLVATLNESDVIVYIEPKRTRQALGGYLAHNIVAQGNYRYLHIAVETQGAERRLVLGVITQEAAVLRGVSADVLHAPGRPEGGRHRAGR